MCSCWLEVADALRLLAKALRVAEMSSRPCDAMFTQCSISARVLIAGVYRVPPNKKGIPCKVLIPSEKAPRSWPAAPTNSAQYSAVLFLFFLTFFNFKFFLFYFIFLIFFFVAFASVGLVIHEFERDPAYRVSIYRRMDLHFWGCRAGIRTRDRLTAVRRADLSATPHPKF